MKEKFKEFMKSITENKKRAVAWLLVVCMLAGISPLASLTVFADTKYKGESMLEDTIGDLNPVPYNNEGLIVDTGFGTFGSVAVADMNDDGYLDLLASSAYIPNPCSVIYYGSADSQNSKSNNYLLMTEPLVVSNTKAQPNGTCIYKYDEKTHLYGDYQYTLINNFGTAMGNAMDWPGASTGYGYSLPAGQFDTYKEAHQNALKAAGETSTFEDKSGNGHYYADYDGDGLLDLIWAMSCTDDNGWYYDLLKSYYDENGVWDKDDDGEIDYENGWIFWYKNTGTAQNHQFDYSQPQVVVVYDWKYDANGNKQIIESTKEPLDVKGTHHAQMKDWDNDGDLDIICTSYVDEVRYFENIGTSTNPIYLKGREISTDKGNVWKNLYAMTFATSADWNNDGYMDWIGLAEQGSVYLVENTGKKTEDNTPIFKEPQYFRQPATNIKIDSESPIYSIDWDEDGDEDILTGDAHGYLSFIKNVTIEKGGDLSNPIWEERVLFTNPDGEVYRIIAGENGSIQGPQEYNYGYTCISVADWDGDGTLDVMSNNIWGKVFWHRGIEGKPYQLEDARPVEVEWEGEAKYPAGNWWKPEGNELVTLWRTNPFMIDLNDDGLMDLVMMDTQGRLAYYERYESADGTLKLKEGQNIFKDASGNVFRLRGLSDKAKTVFNETGSAFGQDGRIKFTLADWNKDGKLDLLYEESPNVQAGEPGNVAYAENVAAKPGEYMFKFPGQTLHTRSLADHSMSPTTCNWNGDDYLDLLVSAADGRIYYMINPLTKENQEDTEPEVPSDPLAQNLVAHWDFEGANPLTDKATAGESTDTLTEVTGAAGTGAVVIENGIATLTGSKALKAADAADLDQTGKMTLFARVKMDDSDIGTSNDTAILDKRRNYSNAEKVYGLLAEKNGTSYNLNFNMRMKENVNIELWKDMPSALDKAQWREIAAVVDHNENGYLTYKVYISKSEVATSGDDYTLLCEGTVDGYTEHAENDLPLYLGNRFELKDSNSTRMLDDVRIYNTALNTEQLAGLIEEGPEHSLVAHWDFEGANPLADKATAGKSTDTLTEVTGSAGTGAVVIENGIATLTGSKALKAADAADLDQTGKMTLFARVKMDDSDIGTSNDTAIIDKRRNFTSLEKVYGLLATKSGTSYNLNFNMRTEDATEVWKDMPNVLDKAQWREIAAVVDYNENGYLTYKVYISKTESATSGDDYTLLCEGTLEGHTKHAENNLPLYLGNTFGLVDSNSARMLDDVRIYNTALNAEQLAGLIEDQPKSTLVAHWDFNGENPLADKAEGGVSDDLTALHEDNVSVTGGLATITSTGALKAADSTDLGITGPMTLFARVQISVIPGQSPAQTGIIYKDGAYKMVTWWVGEQSDVFGQGRHALAFGMNVTGKVVDYNFGRIPNKAWREVAIVVDQNDDGYLTYEMLISKNEATADKDDFLSLYKGTAVYTEHLISNNELLIGYNPDAPDSVSERIFDDVRIYNAALSTQELAEIISPTEDLTANNDTTSYYLSSLGDNQYIAFGINKTTYDVTTEDATLVLAPMAEDDNVIIKVNGTTVTSGATKNYPLNDGENAYEITLHNNVGTLKNRYTINITANLMTVAKLQAEIDAAIAIEQGSYTDTSYAYLQAAIDKAEEVAGTEGVTEAQLRSASKALKEAILDLTTEMRVTDLRALVDDVTSLGLQNTGYKYWDEYQTQLTKAEDLISSSAPYTAEIEATYTALDEAYDKLFTEDDLPVSLEGFRHATLSSFGMEDKDYTGDTEWKFQSVNDSSTTETFDRTLLSMWVDFEFDNAFNGSYKGYLTIMNGSTSSIRIFPEGTGAAIGLNPMNCSGLSYERLDLTKAGVSANNEKFLLQISVEYKDTDSNGVDDQICLGYYANGTLLLEQTGTCDTSLFGNKLFVCGNNGNVIKFASVVPENKDLTNVTTSDFENPGSHEKAVDQTFESGSDVHAYKLNQSNIDNMASTNFQTKITFNGSGYNNGIRYAGTNAEYGIFMYEDGTGDLAVEYNTALSPNIGKTFYIKPAKAGLDTFKATKFILGITTEYADYDGDGDTNDVQMGFYVNGKLYNNQYLYSYDCKDTFGNWLSIYSDTATTAIASVPELIYHNLEQADAYTLETGADWINGKAVEANTLTKSGDYEIAFGSMDNIATYAVLYRPGDAHVDDQSDVRDLVATIKASEGIALQSKAATKAADANEKNNVDAEDVTTVRNMLIQ